MIIRDRSWPHPVLASFKDDVSPNDFEMRVSVSNDADNFYVDVTFSYANPTLTKLIQETKATYCVLIECKRNYFRELYSFNSLNSQLSIKAPLLVGRIEVAGFIRSQDRIESYQISGSHTDYGNVTFDIQAGDVLAVARSFGFDALPDYDPLTRISSILTIKRSDAMVDGPMKLETSDDRMLAVLSQNDYDHYTDLKGDPALGALLANQVVVPALLEAIHEIKNTSEEDFDLEKATKRWFRSIVRKLEDSGTSIQQTEKAPLEIVQQLLSLPLRRSLRGLIELSPMDESV